MQKKKSKVFEDYIEDLNEIVKKMESDNMNLEDMIKSYEDGMKLINVCSNELVEVEKRVKVLIEKNNKIIEKDIEK